MASCAEEVELKKDNILIYDAKVEDFFYLILAGEFRISKIIDGKNYTISTLKQGDILGELAVLDNFPRTANATATQNSKVLRFNIQKIKENRDFFNIYFKISKKTAQNIAQKLIKSNESTIKSFQEKIILAQFCITILYIGSISFLFIGIGHSVLKDMPVSTYISSALILLIFFLVINMIKKTKKPLEEFGLTFKNASKNIFYAILYSLPLIILAIILKLALITYVPALQKFPLFDMTAIFTNTHHFSYISYFSAIAIYTLFAPIQVISAQSGMQKALHVVMKNPFDADGQESTPWRVIFFTSFLFIIPHAYLGYFFSIATFVPSLLWCWLFFKQKSVVGPIVSHVLIGLFVIFILGFENMF